MILKAIMDSVLALIKGMLNFVNIPSVPSINSVLTFLDSVIGYGLNIYKYFIPPMARVLLTIIISVEIIVDVYFVAMWIVKKIPMASID